MAMVRGANCVRLTENRPKAPQLTRNNQPKRPITAPSSQTRAIPRSKRQNPSVAGGLQLLVLREGTVAQHGPRAEVMRELAAQSWPDGRNAGGDAGRVTRLPVRPARKVPA